MTEKLNQPCSMRVEKDKTYSWCACGKSAKLPLCDGTHKTQSDLKSVKWTASADQEVTFCNCRQTQNPPFCDGSHSLMSRVKNVSMMLLVLLMACFPADAKGPRNCNRSGKESKTANFGKRAMPLAALAVNAYHLDWVGAIISQGMSHGLYGIGRAFENKIGKRRPCGCNGAFPSGHMIMYAASSSALHYRYGWKYGFPGYVLSFAFAADRVKHKSHSWGDMIGTFALTNAIMWAVTPRFTKDVEYLPSFSNDDPKLTPAIKAQREGCEIAPTGGPAADGIGLWVSAKF